MSFTAPVRDQRLTLDAVVRIGELAGGPDAEMVDAVLDGAAALAEGEFAPLARIGDTVGARPVRRAMSTSNTSDKPIG